ncbi:iron(III) transport system permease protein [Kribbella sp. VKM Ac-2527]|uniref:Iron(III) transport system permease protein n=1 Tax=Kribbella caucasensis TaxID=2512215 RepID=A0A4R6KN96_9ACTN|nr:ABC transporter permease subunit [Kribbella sp. VKM Ac-2527]TDO51570.1 iron(III) transport system permease protein [Kribbella sp. VKM Ac-2527]
MTTTTLDTTHNTRPEEPGASAAALAFLKRQAGPGVTYALVATLAVLVLAPLIIYYARALENGAAPLLGLPEVPGLGSIFITTLLLALGSTAVATALAVLLGMLVMRTPMRVRGIAAFLPQLPLVVPPVAMIVGWTFIFAPRVGYGNVALRQLPFFDHLSNGPINVYSVPAITVITGLELAGIVFALVYARLNEIGGSLTAAARLSGASMVRSVLTVTLPLLRPALVAGVVVAFLLGLGQFTAPLLLGTTAGVDVLTTEIFRMREEYPINYGSTAALGLPLLLVGVLSIVLQRRVIGDQRKYATQSSDRTAGERTSRWAFLAVVTYSCVTTVVPLLAIMLVAVSPYWSGDLSSIAFTGQHFGSTLNNPQVTESVVNSMVTSLLAAVVVLPLGFFGAVPMSGAIRVPRGVRAVLDAVFLAPLAVPRALLGMAVLYVFLRPPFSLYGTTALFVIGYAFIVLPFALRSQYSSLIGVHSSLFEASRICGAGPLTTVLRVALPLARRGMTAAMAIMLILLSHDFAVSVMVRSPGNHVMGTVIYEFWENGGYPEVAVMSLVMSAVTGILLALTIWAGGRSALAKI